MAKPPQSTGNLTWGRLLPAAVIAVVLTVLMAALLALFFTLVLGLEGRRLDSAAEFATGPAADLGLACFVFWQALLVVRSTGERPVAHGLLVGATAAFLLQLVIRFLAPPIYPGEAVADLAIGLVAGSAAAAAGSRSIAGARALLKTTKTFKLAADAEGIARAIAEHMNSPRIAGVCLLEDPSPEGPGPTRALACWPRAAEEVDLPMEGPALPDHDAWTRLAEASLPAPLASWARLSGASSTALAAPVSTAPALDDYGEARVALLLALRKPSPLSAATRTAYLTLAEEAATAVANLRLIERERENAARLSQADERKRLSRELHDTTKGSFAGLRLLVSASLNALPEDGEPADSGTIKRTLQMATRVIDEAVEDHDRIIGSMRRSALEALPLPSAIRERAERWSTATGVLVSVSTQGYRRGLNPSTEDQIFAVLEESLTNVAKYADAKAVDVTLVFAEDAAILTVRDDGNGFDPRSLKPRDHGGVGLNSMRERANRLGGALSINSAPGSGSTVKLQVPVTKR